MKDGMIPDEIQENVFRELLEYFSRADYRLSPPALGRELHRMLRKALGNSDPYLDIKRKSNLKMLKILPYLEEIVHKAPDAFDAALKLSIAGNVLDWGAHHRLDVIETIHHIAESSLALDHTAQLKEDLKHAERVLYIGDNAGEIVLDKLFIEILDHPDLYFAVRGQPVLNDALKEDAVELGIDKIASIITTGDDTPGVILSTASQHFRDIFNSADVIISKGQGNYEGLSGEPANIYFLLVTKCSLLAAHIGVPEKAFVALGQKHKGIREGSFF